MKIAIACDHGALALKNSIIAHLEKQGHQVVNYGTNTLASSSLTSAGCSGVNSTMSLSMRIFIKFASLI